MIGVDFELLARQRREEEFARLRRDELEPKDYRKTLDKIRHEIQFLNHYLELTEPFAVQNQKQRRIIRRELMDLNELYEFFEHERDYGQ